MGKNKFSLIVLTFNDGLMLERLLSTVDGVSDIIVVDSGDCGSIEALCSRYGARYYFNEFINQAKQINWALDNIKFQFDWVLRLDTDEIVGNELLGELDELATINKPVVGYIDRKMVWMGRMLKFSAPRPLYLGRFWKIGHARYEEVTEEHLLHSCESVFLRHSFFEYNINNRIDYFVKKHDVTAAGELMEILNVSTIEKGNISGKRHQRVRWFKLNVYNKIPRYLAPLIYFMYRYFFRLGFLDGKAGFSFCFFQAFWYRMFIAQLIDEHNNPSWFQLDPTKIKK